MRLEADWLHDTDALAVVRALEAAGHRAWFVGGAVRNAIIGAGPTDIDIATDAKPEEVIRAVEAAGLRAVPTGIDHGTVTVVSGGRGFEVTTLRRDVATDGRRAVVAFSDSLEEDARRRDFTMNALYATPEGEVIDLVGGIEDALAGRVRFVGDPHQRIAEDYLRILRFFRFLAWFGREPPDADALDAIARGLDGLERLSRERVGMEMRKLLAAPDPSRAVAIMERVGVLQRVLPGASARLLGPLVELERAAGLAPDPIRRLAALGGEDVAERLRLSRAEARRLEEIRKAMAMSPAEAAYRFGPVVAWDAALINAAAMATPLPADLREQIEKGAAARFPVRAEDLPGLEGPALGARLRALERAWIDSGFTLSREELLALP